MHSTMKHKKRKPVGINLPGSYQQYFTMFYDPGINVSSNRVFPSSSGVYVVSKSNGKSMEGLEDKDLD